MSLRLRVSGGMAAKGVPQKVMILSYFAETKGVVGCDCEGFLVVKVRDLMRLLN
jgi:hypothetical protein